VKNIVIKLDSYPSENIQFLGNLPDHGFFYAMSISAKN